MYGAGAGIVREPVIRRNTAILFKMMKKCKCFSFRFRLQIRPPSATMDAARKTRTGRLCMKKKVTVLGVLLRILLALVLIAAAYIAYVFIAYHRIGSIQLFPDPDHNSSPEKQIAAGEPLEITSWNIGFGAYEADYGFFMDGGHESWAWSKERLDANLKKISALLAEQGSDLYLIQEVDMDSTRSYHFDERKYLTGALPSMTAVSAQNYDSPFLMYPFYQPHGASKSCLMTFTNANVTEARRVELPIENGFTKFLDLDRCYSVQYIPANDGKQLVLYNFHLSAYTSDGTIATEQLKLLLADMQREYDKGNYCIAGGDFNKDLLGDSTKIFGVEGAEYSWAQPIPPETFDGVNTSLIAPFNEAKPVPSCRNADSAYHKGQYVITVDGFLVSDNVTVLDADVIDTGFACSDHNPVQMHFILGEKR